MSYWHHTSQRGFDWDFSLFLTIFHDFQFSILSQSFLIYRENVKGWKVMRKSMVFTAILCQVLKCSETYCNYPEFVILAPLLILKMHRCSQSNQRTGGRALWATKKLKTLWTSVLSSFTCRLWWKWHLWNLEAPVSVASVIFSHSFLYLRPWSLAIGLFSCCGAPPFICTWVIFFSRAQPHCLTPELKQLLKDRESTKGFGGESEGKLTWNSSLHRKFHKPILIFLACLLCCFI